MMKRKPRRVHPRISLALGRSGNDAPLYRLIYAGAALDVCMMSPASWSKR